MTAVRASRRSLPLRVDVVRNQDGEGRLTDVVAMVLGWALGTDEPPQKQSGAVDEELVR